jgi:hypothetical protein
MKFSSSHLHPALAAHPLPTSASNALPVNRVLPVPEQADVVT